MVNISNGALDLHSLHPKLSACLWLGESHAKLH